MNDVVERSISLKNSEWSGTIDTLSYYYISVRDFLRIYLVDMKHRRHENWLIASSVVVST